MAIRLLVTRGFGNGTFDGDVAHVVTRGYGAGAPVTPTDVRRDRDAWHGKKKRLPSIIYKPRSKSHSAQDLETLDELWAKAKAKYNRPEPEVIVAKNSEYSPLELARFVRDRQEAEDEEIVLKAALEYLFD